MKAIDLLESEIGDTGKTVKESIQEMDHEQVEELLTKIEEIADGIGFEDDADTDFDDGRDR